jgi:hypothetical protein
MVEGRRGDERPGDRDPLLPGVGFVINPGSNDSHFFIFLPNYEMILPDGFNRALSFKDF